MFRIDILEASGKHCAHALSVELVTHNQWHDDHSCPLISVSEIPLIDDGVSHDVLDDVDPTTGYVTGFKPFS
eukprot:11418570-Karenia_brevis.AAC.1